MQFNETIIYIQTKTAHIVACFLCGISIIIVSYIYVRNYDMPNIYIHIPIPNIPIPNIPIPNIPIPNIPMPSMPNIYNISNV